MTDFLFHKVSESEKKEIKKQAKEILDDFSRQLSRVKLDKGEPIIERGTGEREEGKDKCSEFNRETFFKNAPKKSKDFIMGEKGKW